MNVYLTLSTKLLCVNCVNFCLHASTPACELNVSYFGLPVPYRALVLFRPRGRPEAIDDVRLQEALPDPGGRHCRLRGRLHGRHLLRQAERALAQEALLRRLGAGRNSAERWKLLV